ncbi:MAG: ATP-binding protein [Candidatus Omnitrophota bacterium]|jgi:signal transduction histidine kinase
MDEKKAMNAVLKEELGYQSKILSISFEIRILNLLVGLIAINILKKIFCFPFGGEIFAVLYLWLITCVIYLVPFKLFLLKTRKSLERVHFSYYFLGVAYVTVFAHFLGGIEWVAFAIYLFDLVYANILMKRLKASIVTAFAVFSYITLGLLEYKGMIPHHRLVMPGMAVYNNPEYLLGFGVIAVGGIFYLFSFSMGLFAEIRNEREKNILDSKKRFEFKSTQLEKMAKALKKKVAENTYLRRAAIGYVEKKEFELEAAKKDLEDQIEKLRKTQRSMFFMIEDLNEMSSQLKDARDHLEEKVRERTDELLDISKKLHRSERLAFLGKLAGSVTHELRNPLAVLKNAVYFLDKKFTGKKDEKVLKYIEILKKEISVVDAIIDDIMGFAKTRPPRLEAVDLKEVIENAVSMIHVPELVDVKKEYEKLPKIQCDSNQLMHAVVNIANNAIIAMNGNGTLTFRLGRENEKAYIEVEDTGCGIPPDQRDLIFEPLYSSKPKGTGLGLPIAKMMLENQEGTIDFMSELGGGTIFRISLPLKRKAHTKNEKER